MAENTLIKSINTKPIYRKGVSYYLFPCVDCGRGHLTQKRNGGQPRSPRCLSCASKIKGTGRVLSLESRARISQSLKGHKGVRYWLGRKLSSESIKKRTETRRAKDGYVSPNKGNHYSAESRERIRQAVLARPSITDEQRKIRSENSKRWHENHRHPMLGNTHTEDAKAKISYHSREWHKTHAHPNLGKTLTKEQCRTIGDASRQRWSDPKYKDNLVEKITKSNFKRPTQPEVKMLEILNELCPNEYKYTGDGTMVINGQCPDFTNVNGDKKVIEVFGDFWHSEKIRGKSRQEEMSDKILEYAEYGYRCLIIWEREFKNPQGVIDKVLGFIRH